MRHVRDFGKFSVNEAEQTKMDSDSTGAPTFAYILCTTKSGKERIMEAFLDAKEAGESLADAIDFLGYEHNPNKEAISKAISYGYVRAILIDDLAEIAGESGLNVLLKYGHVGL